MRKQRKEKEKKEEKERQSFSTPPLITLRGSTAVFLPTLPYNFGSLCLLMMSLEWSITIY